jgi:7,8-dihydroneopterin aldolase/epimerase/oxygenase
MSGQELPPDRTHPDRIELRGLGVLGTHGALPEEHERAQPFEVDLDLELDLRQPGRTDRLADTVDYGSVTEAVAAVVSGPHVNLLEHLAERIASAALASAAPHASAVTVSVRKTRPPVPHLLTSAGVTIRRVGPADLDPDYPHLPSDAGDVRSADPPARPGPTASTPTAPTTPPDPDRPPPAPPTPAHQPPGQPEF